MLIYSYINTSGNWKNEKLCGNTTPAGRSVFTQFRVFPIFTSVDITVYQYGKNVLYFFYNIAQRTLTECLYLISITINFNHNIYCKADFVSLSSHVTKTLPISASRFFRKIVFHCSSSKLFTFANLFSLMSRRSQAH